MKKADGNLFETVPSQCTEEQVLDLLATEHVKIERIVSCGQASPEDFWYDQASSEWVVVLSGSAGLLFEYENEPVLLGRGDHIYIAAHKRHRVEWTAADEPTIWLAIHFA
jgi:cupin 2 domain-containing protein